MIMNLLEIHVAQVYSVMKMNQTRATPNIYKIARKQNKPQNCKLKRNYSQLKDNQAANCTRDLF
jgi:hypothetical protein